MAGHTFISAHISISRDIFVFQSILFYNLSPFIDHIEVKNPCLTKDEFSGSVIRGELPQVRHGGQRSARGPAPVEPEPSPGIGQVVDLRSDPGILRNLLPELRGLLRFPGNGQ